MEFNAEETAIVSSAPEVTKGKMIFNETTSQLTQYEKNANSLQLPHLLQLAQLSRKSL